MSKEGLYIHDSGEEPSSVSPAQRAFFRYQYTLGSYEYWRKHGDAAEVEALRNQLGRLYDHYTALRDHPEDLYTAYDPGSAQTPQPHVLRDALPARRQPDIFARLEQAVGAIQDSETFRAYLDVQARFHRYSPNNVALILSQRPSATRVAGYNDWLRMHRFVKRGESAIRIIVPLTKKTVNAQTGEEERHLFFGTGHVFDLAQTDGEPLPTVELPVLERAEGDQLYALLSDVAERQGLHIDQSASSDMRPEQMGFLDRAQQRIALRPAAQLQMTKTLAHELAHHFAGHERSDEESETVAESVAYVVLAHYGLDSGQRSFPYIATWSQDKKILQAAMGTIQKVSATLIDSIERQLTEAEGPPPHQVVHGWRHEDQDHV